jgi:site-specific recombinase XerD
MTMAPIPKKHDLDLVGHQVADYLAAASAPATRRAYSSDWRQFEVWCSSRSCERMPATPAAVTCYVVDQAEAGKKVASLERALVAIGRAHQLAGAEDPTKHRIVRETMKGIRRRKSSVQKKAQPLLLESLKVMVAAMRRDEARDLRDIALLCLGFMTGLRRSELVALDVADLKWAGRGLTVRVRRSKGDQAGEGRDVVVFRGTGATCPVAAVEAWLAAAGIEHGPVFVGVDRYGHARVGKRLTDQVVRTVVKTRARAAGLDEFEQLSGHSLRAGLATQAALNGANLRDIAKQTGHKSEKVLSGYIRDADLWRNNVTERLGLS